MSFVFSSLQESVRVFYRENGKARRQRQNLFGLKTKKDETGKVKFTEGHGHLLRFFKDMDFRLIRSNHIDDYIKLREQQGASPNTILKEIATLSAMSRFAVAEGLILFNPARDVEKPVRQLVRPNHTPTQDELKKIFKKLEMNNRRFFEALLNSGCRKSELSSCNVKDADLKEKHLRVVGKGRKERFIPMNKKLFEVISEELAQRPKIKPNDPLFVDHKGKRIRSLRGAITRACKLAGVPHILHHSLRHAYATLQYDRGADPVILSRLLGHANPTITQNIYIKVLDPRIRKEAEDFEVDLDTSELQESSKDE